MRTSALWCSTALAFGLGQAALAADWNALAHAGGQSADWLVYGGNLANTRFVPNDEINAGNVDDLKLQWIFQSGIIGSLENTPIVEDGVMYVTTPYNHVFAIDAHTGRQLWHYEHKLGTTIFCCGPNNRGVALADDRVYMATLDAMLVALDKRTGELVWETEIADPEFGYSQTVAPTVYQDKVILGISGAEYGIRGFISAYDKDTGRAAWRQDKLANRQLTAPLSLGKYVVVSDVEGYVHLISSEDGSFAARAQGDGPTRAAPIDIGPGFAVQSAKGGVVAFKLN